MSVPLIPTGIIDGSKCPRCGSRLMVVTKKIAQRQNPYSIQHPQFVGCIEYPICGYNTVVTDDVREKMTATKPELVVDF